MSKLQGTSDGDNRSGENNSQKGRGGDVLWKSGEQLKEALLKTATFGLSAAVYSWNASSWEVDARESPEVQG